MTEDAGYNVYTIPAWQNFVRTLAAYLLQKTQGEAEALSSYRLLLPTRRACRVMRETFLSLNNGEALILPQMSAMGDVDEENLSLMMFGEGGGFLDISPPVSPLKRQIMLARLVYAMPDYAHGMEHAFALAKALGKFIDQIVIEGLDFADLYKIVPEEFSEHWQITLEFLHVISHAWPKILDENGVIEATKYRNLMMGALVEHWQKKPPSGHIVAAGSSGSIPAAAELLQLISTMENGMVVLPGLDQGISEKNWKFVSDTHPQHSLKILLQRIGIKRSDVRVLDAGMGNSDGSLRHDLASALMLPAQKTGEWKNFAANNDLGLMIEGLEYYQCATLSEEAGVISMIMREALENKDSVCALVTPDRGLARRVKAFCRRWSIEVDDSAGANMADTAQGKLALLCLEAAGNKFDPVLFLSLLKSKLFNLGYDCDLLERCVSDLEKLVLRRGNFIASHKKFQEIVLNDEAISDEVKRFVADLYIALSPLIEISANGEFVSAISIIKAHIRALEAISYAESDVLWAGDFGRQTAQFFAQLVEYGDLMGNVSYNDYMNVIASLMRDVTIRVAYGQHPRLLILGQMEARLTKADIVIMGGLNEGVWPGKAGHDPWMSRPMRSEFGLPAQEQVVGFSAHDFVQGFCSARVVMTRAQKVGGVPTLASRWLDRLDVILQAANYSLDELSKEPYLDWVRNIDITEAKPFARPQPCPPAVVRPKAISVTKADVWLKDPYSIYVYYVLGLRKLPSLRNDNEAALKGILLHRMLDRFVQDYPKILPDDAQKAFLSIAADVFHAEGYDGNFMQAWWPRLVNMAEWISQNETSWREKAEFIASEIKGSIEIEIDGEPFGLHGIADRVDRFNNGEYAIIDYKSGGTFSEKKLKEGEFTQLPLEALILQDAGFEELSDKGKKADIEAVCGKVGYLGYWKISGAKEAGKITFIDADISETIGIAKEGLENLVRLYRKEDTPYYCMPDMSQMLRYYDYELLSRLKEWSVTGNDDE